MLTTKRFLPFLIAIVLILASAIVMLTRLRKPGVPSTAAQTISQADDRLTGPQPAILNSAKAGRVQSELGGVKTVQPEVKEDRMAGNQESAKHRDTLVAAAKSRDIEGEDGTGLILRRNGKEIRVKQEHKPGERFDQPAEAMRWYLQKRLPRGEKELPVERYFTAREQIKEMPQFSTPLNRMMPSESQIAKDKSLAPEGVPFVWANLGPGNVGGRTRTLVIDPNNANIMYAGAVDGGIWKSTNAGASWAPQDDFMANIAVTCMAIDTTNTQILYAGTGEGFFNGDAVRGAGIFKTTNGGTTWTRLASTNTSDFFLVSDVVVSPANAMHIYASTRTGVQRSLDGGTTWSLVLASNAANGANGAMDLVMRTDQGTDYIFAALGTFSQSHIWRNTDAGGAGTWTDVYTEANMGRGKLAIAPSSQGTIYAMFTQNSAGNYQDGLLAVIRSTSNGDAGSWSDRIRNSSADIQSTLLLTNPLFGVFTQCGGGASQFLNQGWYDNVLAVDPLDSNIVWAGGIDLFRSNDGGVNWGVASYWWFSNNGVPPASNPDTNYNHADHHVILFHPGYNGDSNKIMYTGNDGGIFRTNDARANVGYPTGTVPGGSVTPTSPICGNPVANSVAWTALNNSYQVSQFYHGLPYPNGTTYFGGTQDNGTNRGTDAAGPNAWERIFGGDGGYVAVDPSNTQNLYIETTGLSFRKSTNGGTNFAGATSGISGDTFPFISVFQMDPSNSQRVWLGGRFMWRTDTASTTTTWNRASTQITGGAITAIAIAPTNQNRVITGAGSGQIRGTTIGTTAISTTDWVPQVFTPRGNGNGTISWITFDPTNELIAYCTISAFNGTPNAQGTNSGHVYRSTDGGLTWTLRDGTGTNSIPDIPAHSIVVVPNNPNRLYVGTDLGVFVSLDAGANWFKEAAFPNVVTESLSVNTVAGQVSVYAFTHGRSAYRVLITPTASPANVSGRIVNDAGQPVAAVTMRLTGESSATTITDSNGDYRFRNVNSGGFYTVTPELVNYHFSPSNRSFSLVADQTDAVFTATPDAISVGNAIDSAEYFVRQQYLDFLGREPEAGGFNYWSDQLAQCHGDANCLRSRRIDVSAAFFMSREFEDTGSFVYRMYRGSLGRQLRYAEFSADRALVVGGPNLEASKSAFVNSFVQRAEFAQKYQSNTSAESFVDALLQTTRDASGVDLSSERASLISRYNSGTSMNESRALVVRDVVDEAAFGNAIYNESFVAMEYYGYLRRDFDRQGFEFWVNVLTNSDRNNYRGMVCSFLTSAEYQRRFSSVVTHSNSECDGR